MMPFRSRVDAPTLFHVTHYKAGSQWIHQILRRCFRRQIVRPQADLSQFLKEPIQQGKVYPTLYLTRQQFETVRLPRRWRRFIVIRDLRDTLVSGYFSLKLSHPKFRLDAVNAMRERLRNMELEEGLMHTLDDWIPANAEIQQSWIESGEPFIRFEDLLEDEEILERILIDEYDLPLGRGRLRRAVKRARFERLSGGRARGEEDPTDHWRKGIAGDWRNYFTEPLKQAFKERWGSLLIAAGYERDAEW